MCGSKIPSDPTSFTPMGTSNTTTSPETASPSEYTLSRTSDTYHPHGLTAPKQQEQQQQQLPPLEGGNRIFAGGKTSTREQASSPTPTVTNSSFGSMASAEGMQAQLQQQYDQHCGQQQQQQQQQQYASVGNSHSTPQLTGEMAAATATTTTSTGTSTAQGSMGAPQQSWPGLATGTTAAAPAPVPGIITPNGGVGNRSGNGFDNSASALFSSAQVIPQVSSASSLKQYEKTAVTVHTKHKAYKNVSKSSSLTALDGDSSSNHSSTIIISNSTNSMNSSASTIHGSLTNMVDGEDSTAAKKGKKKGRPEDTVTKRRQKRLERNRESARLSRRRRKQYLEVLEEKVATLSNELDGGRRTHASQAVSSILTKRKQLILQTNQVTSHEMQHHHTLELLDRPLNRCSQEMLVVSTFLTQQCKSFCLPPQNKFVLWMTLQADTFFRGGRSASERLSAARIGEKMLQAGKDRAAPTNNMWPLVCNEIGLSYDQEERVRQFQRTLLQTPPTWLERHKSKASALTMKSLCDSFQTVSVKTRQRERNIHSGLSAKQRLDMYAWAEKNADRIKAKLAEKRKALAQRQVQLDKFQVDTTKQDAANLYILNNRLGKIVSSMPSLTPFVSTAALRKLCRRPSFESLGQKEENSRGGGLSHEESFSSTNSLQQSASINSIEEERQQQVTPEDGQNLAIPLVEKELGYVKEIIPQSRPPVPYSPTIVASSSMHAVQPPSQQDAAMPLSLPIPNPTPFSVVQQATLHHANYATHYNHSQAPAATSLTMMENQSAGMPQPQMIMSNPIMVPSTAPQGSYYQPVQMQQHDPYQYQMQAPVEMVQSGTYQQGDMQQQHQQEGEYDVTQPNHERQSSFLPPHLTMVPEDMFPAGEGTDDIFISLMEDGADWAIGEGVDMDTTAG